MVMEALKSDPEALATKTQWDPLDVYLGQYISQS